MYVCIYIYVCVCVCVMNGEEDGVCVYDRGRGRMKRRGEMCVVHGKSRV